MGGKVVGEHTIRRLVGKAATKMVGNETSGLAPKSKHQLTIKEGPSGIPVQHEDRSALPFSLVEVMQVVTIGKFEKLAVEGVFFPDVVGELQFEMEWMIQDRPLPMPRRTVGFPGSARPAS